jgi:hypothetical protein
VVAVQRQFDAAPETGAVDRRQGRKRQGADPSEEHVAGAAAGDRLLPRPDARELVQVGAGGENERLPGHHERHPLARLELVEHARARLEGAAPEDRRLRVVLSVVDRDERDAPLGPCNNL